MKKFTAFMTALCCIAGSAGVLPVSAESSVLWNAEEDDFFVVTGVYGENSDIVLDYYYYTEGDAGENYKHRKTVLYDCPIDDLSYGDILLADGDFETVKIDNTLSTYQLVLNEETTLSKEGNCNDLLENRILTVKTASYDGHPIQPYFSYFTFHLDDGTGTDYYYSADYWGASYGISMREAKKGDKYVFAVYRDMAIIPLSKCVDYDVSNPEVLSNVEGDVNNDGRFGISDVVSLERWLLAVAGAELVNWEAGDLYRDGKLNAVDMIEMKKLLVR